MSEGKAVTRRKKLTWLTLKRKILILVALLAIAGLWFAWRQISSPVEGTTVVTDASKSLNQSKKPTTPAATDINNDYFELALPAGYRPQSKSESVPGLLYQQTFIKPSTMGSVVVNIAIKQTPDGGMNADTAYQMRAKNPARYTMSSEAINGQNITLASDAQAASIVAFMARGGYMATVSASSGVSNPSSDNVAQRKALQPVLEAWRWR